MGLLKFHAKDAKDAKELERTDAKAAKDAKKRKGFLIHTQHCGRSVKSLHYSLSPKKVRYGFPSARRSR